MDNNKRQLIYITIIIVLLTLSIRASNNMIMTTIPLVAKYDLKFSETLVGLISATIAFFTFIASGLINSRLHVSIRRKVFIASNLGFAILMPLFYLSNLITIWLISALTGFVLGFIMPNIITSAGLVEDRRARERLLSIYTLALSISLVIGPALESLILKYFSLRDVFLFFTPFGLLSVALSPFIKFPSNEQRASNHITHVWSNNGFKVAVFNILSYNVPFAFILTFGGIYARDQFNASYSLITSLFALFFTTSLLARLFLSIKPVEKIWHGVIFSIAMSVIGLTLMLFSRNILIYALALIILGFPHGLTYPFSIISISRTFKPQERNAANSMFFSIMMLIGVVTPFVTGFIVDEIGIRTTFGLLIPVILLMLVLIGKYVKYVDNIEPQTKVNT